MSDLQFAIYNLQLGVTNLLQKRDRLQIALQDAAQVDAHQLFGFIARRGRNIQPLDRIQRLGLQEA